MKFDNLVPTVKEARRVELPLGASVVAFMVTHCDARSPEYLKVKSEVNKPVRKLIEVNALPPERDRELAVRTFVKFSVVGWEGVTSDGKPVPFTEDNCVELLIAAPTLFYSLVDEASERDNFKPGEGDAGNSGKPSNTISSSGADAKPK